MKRVLFLTKSKLSHNLMELIIPSIPKKIIFTGLHDCASLSKQFFPKPVQLILLDDNFLAKESLEDIEKALKSNALKNAKRLALTNKDSQLKRESLANLNIEHYYTKPFLADELAEIINTHLGHKK